MRTLPCIFSILLVPVLAGYAVAAEPRDERSANGPPLQVDRMFDELRDARDDLKLSRDQDVLWLEAEKATRAAVWAARNNRQKLVDLFAAEITKEVMDLERIARESERGGSDNSRQRMLARDKWLQLFRSLNGDQKALASRRIRDRLQRMRALRERAMLPGMAQPGPPN